MLIKVNLQHKKFRGNKMKQNNSFQSKLKIKNISLMKKLTDV